ncbi:MAG: LamG-like jellyroll fold domain-containing protein, partial [Candidatus Bathyarchaeia archaeon]
LPLLSSTTDTVLYMYYGNPNCGSQQSVAAVWDASYKMVLHLKEAAGVQYDSTINSNNGVPQNGVFQGVPGKIDGADTFDGSNDYVQVSHSGTLTGYTTAFTASFWIRLEDTSRRQVILNKYDTAGNQRGWFIEYNPVDRPTRPFGFYASQDGVNYREWYASFVPTAGVWYYVTVVWEANVVPRFFINGAQVTTVGSFTLSSIYNNAGTPLFIGRCPYNNARYFKGSLDEIRISNPARSASYIQTSYNNQLNPATFYSLGAEEAFEEVYTLTIVVDGQGSVSVAPEKAYYKHGDTVTLTATPDFGYQFTGWSGDLTGTNSPANLTITKNMIVTAHFSIKQYTIIASVSGTGGAIDPSGAVTVTHGEDKTFTITPSYGFHVLDVLVDGESQGAVTTYTFYAVSADHTITAIFAPNEYTLTVNVSPEGSGTVTLNNTGPYYYGDAVLLTAEPNTGWYFSQWTGNLTGSQPSAVVIIDGDKEVTAVFTQELYVLNITIVGNGNVTKDPDKATYAYGENVTLTATADLGWSFSGWSGDAYGVDTQITVTMDGNKSIIATFTENLYILNIIKVGEGTIILDPLQDTYTYGQIVNLTAIPSEGWSFLGWSGDINETANPTQIIIDDNKTVTATFFLANRPPQIDSYTPTTDPAILEGDAQEFTISPSDPDGDDLHIQWYVNDAPVGTNSTEYTFTSDYASAGTYNITVTVSDGLEQATRTWTLTVTDVGPVLDIPFDADANPTPDNSGYGNNGTVNGATWTTAGNGSYYFDGNDYILINDADSLDGNGTWDGMTAELWVYLTTNQQGTRILAKRVSTGTGTDKSYQIGFQSAAPANRIYAGVYLSTSATYYEAGYSTPLNLRTWYHVAMVYNSSTGLILYINGIAVAANTTATGLIKASTQPLCIGSMTSGTGYFTGLLDNVRIFSKALPQEQIIRHYDEAVAVHVNTPPIITSYTPETLEPQVNEGEELPFTQTSIDPERDPTSYTWLLDGEAKSNLQNWTYLPDFDGAGYHNVTLIVSDGFLQATIQWNVTVINVNRPPAITGYYPEEDPIISESASQEFNITCSDPDDDPLLIQWYVNDEAAETNLISYMFPPSPAGTYHVAVMVSDGQAEDWRNWTLTVIAGNVPPEIESVTISPKPAYNSDTLTATPNGWSDPNGDPEGYVWQWQKWDGAEWINITDATSNTLEPLNFANGDQIRVLCTPYDGQAYGETKYDTVTIENRAPTITSYTPTESYPCINQSQQQVFNASANDPDGDPISYTWYLDGASVSTTDSYTFDATLGTSGVHN